MSKRTESILGRITGNNDNEVIVFGIGYAGRMAMYILKNKYKQSVICAFDNSPAKEGKVFWEDVTCRRPELISDDVPVLICIINEKAAKAIRKQCEELGYKSIYTLSEDDIVVETAEWDERECIELMYYCKTGEELNLDFPQNYNEKLQWLKLNDHDLRMRDMTDKLAVKEYVRDTIGSEYVIPTLGSWDTFDEIDFNLLPDKFVLKCTHDSGSVEVIEDKKQIDRAYLKEKFTAALKRDYYYFAREFNYIGIPKRIIAEPILKDTHSKYLKDYKVFVFDEEPKIVQVDYDRFHNHSRIMYSARWENLGFSTMYPYDATKEEPRPEELDELLMLAKQLSKGFRHVRVDFYIADKHIWFGEMTFYHGGGYEKFSDEKWNRTMGEWLKLPEDD